MGSLLWTAPRRVERLSLVQCPSARRVARHRASSVIWLGRPMVIHANPQTEELLPHVMKFVGSSGGGQWRFQILCSVSKCQRMDTISASRRTIKGDRYRLAACVKFARSGWLVRGGPICPTCGSAAAK